MQPPLTFMLSDSRIWFTRSCENTGMVQLPDTVVKEFQQSILTYL